jgi:hypothetical protein
MRHLIPAAIALFLLPGLSRANMIADPGFDVGFVASTGSLSGDTPAVGGDGLNIDDGWINNSFNGADQWLVSGGKAVRDFSANRFRQSGFGQIVTNAENVLSGDSLTLAFDFTAKAPTGLMYRAYGITQTGGSSWLTFNGDGVELSGTLDIDGGPEPAGNYDFASIAYGALGVNTLDSGTHSIDIALTNDYEYFFVGFSAELDNLSGALAEVDNVRLFETPPSPGGAVPEPLALGLVGLASLSLCARRR